MICHQRIQYNEAGIGLLKFYVVASRSCELIVAPTASDDKRAMPGQSPQQQDYAGCLQGSYYMT